MRHDFLPVLRFCPTNLHPQLSLTCLGGANQPTYTWLVPGLRPSTIKNSAVCNETLPVQCGRGPPGHLSAHNKQAEGVKSYPRQYWQRSARIVTATQCRVTHLNNRKVRGRAYTTGFPYPETDGAFLVTLCGLSPSGDVTPACRHSPHIIRVTKSRRMWWAGQVARIGEWRGAYGVLVGKP